MKKGSLISAVIFLITLSFSSEAIYAQEKSKEEMEKELMMQEAIVMQKRAMAEQRRALEESGQEIEMLHDEMNRVLKDAEVNIEALSKDGKVRVITNRGGRTYSFDEPFDFSSRGMEFNLHSFGEKAERTTWEFSKSIIEASFSRDYDFDVDPAVKTVVMAVNGDCKAGEIRVKIKTPDGKLYSDIVIDEFGNLNWRKSFNITETENKDKTGAWNFEIASKKATGYFRISLQAY